MKKNLLSIAILLGVSGLMFTSCEKTIADDETWGGTYEIVINGKVVAEGETEEVGMVFNVISMSKGEDFSVLVSGVPESSGDETKIDEDASEGSVTIMGMNLLEEDGTEEMYFSADGTIKRASGSKVTFEGTCTTLTDQTPIPFSGTLESKAFKLI